MTLDTWLPCGLVAVVGFQIFMLIVNRKLKDGAETWGKHFSLLLVILLGGWFSLIIVFFAYAMGLISIILDTILKYDRLQAPASYLFIFLVIGGIITTSTARRVGARCNDGSYSYATGSGACSYHDGVSSWDKEYWWE